MKVIININDSLIKHKLIKNVFLIQSVFHSKTEKSLLHLGEYTDLCAVEKRFGRQLSLSVRRLHTTIFILIS